MYAFMHCYQTPNNMIKTFTKSMSLLLLATVVLVAACKKDKEESQAVTSANVAGTYTFGSLIYKGTYLATGQTVQEDATDSIPACERDNLMTLKSDGTVQYQDVGTVCNPNESSTGTWSLSGTSLNINGDVANVDELTNKKLVVSIKDTANGYAIVQQTTFNRK
jgi:hypothetical protein